MIVGIFGVQGGGTSAIAGVVKLHGFTMYGEPKTLDDNELLAAAPNFFPLIDERGDDWAFKHPFLTPHIHTLKKHIPDLKPIYIFRDPIASAYRARVKKKFMMEEDYKAMGDMFNGPDGLYLSYERVIRDREKAVNEIAEYLERPVNPRAIEWLNPDLGYRNIKDYE